MSCSFFHQSAKVTRYAFRCHWRREPGRSGKVPRCQTVRRLVHSTSSGGWLWYPDCMPPHDHLWEYPVPVLKLLSLGLKRGCKGPFICINRVRVRNSRERLGDVFYLWEATNLDSTLQASHAKAHGSRSKPSCRRSRKIWQLG